ncbi:MAG: hypothetical protein HC934_02315 [Acaryochloridaceae cyanobacterium SU_2_1]|nr:hypothetical protein [Acaryochloridaceae cyanobacterium SU_2_1]
MQDFKKHPESDLDTMMKRNTFQVGLECLSALGALGGTIAIVVAKELAYVAAFATGPLTLSVLLNLYNRRQLDQLTRRLMLADTTEIQRRLSADVQSVKSQLDSLPASQERNDYQEVKLSVTSLSETVSGLERQMLDSSNGQSLETLSALEEEINQLREYQIDLSHSLEALQGQIPASFEPGTTSEGLHQQFLSLQSSVAELSEQTQVRTEGTMTDLEPVRAELRAMLAPIQQQVADLCERIDQQSLVPSSVDSGSDVDLSQMSGQIEDVRVKMDTMLANISEEMETARHYMATTQNQVNEVQQRLGEISPQAEGIQSEELNHQLQTTLGPLQEHIGQLEGKLNNLPTVDPALTQEHANQLQGLHHQIQELGSQLQQLSTRVADLPNMVSDQVQAQVNELQAQQSSVAPDKQEQLSELDALLADLT